MNQVIVAPLVEVPKDNSSTNDLNNPLKRISKKGVITGLY